jgi:hypothetical protein
MMYVNQESCRICVMRSVLLLEVCFKMPIENCILVRIILKAKSVLVLVHCTLYCTTTSFDVVRTYKNTITVRTVAQVFEF